MDIPKSKLNRYTKGISNGHADIEELLRAVDSGRLKAHYHKIPGFFPIPSSLEVFYVTERPFLQYFGASKLVSAMLLR